MILPKNHLRYFDELDESTSSSIMNAAKMISKVVKELFKPEGITVCQNGGSFDELTYFHMHIVPRCKWENFADFYTDEREQMTDEVSLLKTKTKIIEAIRGYK